jgi:hypothetical protein
MQFSHTEFKYLYPQMKYNSNQQNILAIKNGDEDVLLSLSKKYYPSTRRYLRRKGFSDKNTPYIFSDILVSVYREIQLSINSSHIEIEQLFFNSLNAFINNNKPQVINDHGISDEKIIVSSCFDILDESSKKLLAARYVENLNFEQIASRFNFSNPVIAQFEFERSFSQYENISRARMNVNAE